MLTPPTLEHVCDLLVDLDPVRELGRGRAGARRIIPIVGGTVTGPRISGRILNLGADWQTIFHDGVAELDARYAIETGDGALIEVANHGYRHGPPEVIERLRNRFKLAVETGRPAVAYRETIRRSADQHARHKKQSGGHGQYADIKVKVEPVPRGTGFQFEEKIVGGSVPKQYIPAVEEGSRDYVKRGPLGFPVVDIKVTLYDGGFHSVDSSDMAFKIAARLALSEALPKCDPVRLEPIHEVTISVPSDATSRVHGILSSRRGQILGFDAKDGWPGWDAVTAYLPEAEIHDLILELRAQSQGLASFEWRFDHLSELTGRLADQVVQHREEADAR